MKLGAFSVSLNVSNILVSKAFYEKLGFEVMHGDVEQNWLIMKNGQTVIGLFEGMFEKNILTFNPGWNQEGDCVDPYTDVRDIQKKLRQEGIDLLDEVDESTSGPGSIIIVDPDGNPIMFDQHR